ncbi:Rv3654c family TadE-like protein [Mycobacterium sp. M26]|uniref:Rv3654c family TadE-like protein n=1 Tax=Mycobacterium sp. M26 TaxID=1762962 RepID=UPI001E3F195E|nr:Rv3654c family TadE-like protein [Mycobacterium sp. M26]
MADESGAATVLGAMLIIVVVVLTMGGVHLGAAVVARHRAQASADLAALAAAVWLPHGPAAACRQAGAVTAAMSAALLRCDVDHLDVVIGVGVGRARAVARAGPVR